jgi:hypothetical protein
MVFNRFLRFQQRMSFHIIPHTLGELNRLNYAL